MAPEIVIHHGQAHIPKDKGFESSPGNVKISPQFVILDLMLRLLHLNVIFVSSLQHLELVYLCLQLSILFGVIR